MTDEVQVEIPADEHTPVGKLDNGRAPSVIDLLKQDYEEFAQRRSTLIFVPGYERVKLQVKYGLPKGKQLDKITRDVLREFKDTYSRNLWLGVDTMIELSDGLYVHPDGYDNPVPLDPDESGEAVGFNQVLAESLGWQVRTAREVVMKLFDNNHQAIADHVERLNGWMRNTKVDVNSAYWQFVGE